MSTRATYQFNSTEHHSVTYYIHHDGYETGAAQYFVKALRQKNKRGGLATMFLRANPNCAFTDSHDGHGDTEFRYTVNCDDLTMDGDKRQPGAEWVGNFRKLSLIDFLQAQAPEDGPYIPFGGQIFHLSDFDEMIQHKAMDVAQWLARGMIGNSNGNHSQLERLCAARFLIVGDAADHRPELNPLSYQAMNVAAGFMS